MENSFESGDSINAIDWNLKTRNLEVFNYVKALINLRKQHPGFRMTTKEAISENLQFLKTAEGAVAFMINGKAVGDSWNKIIVVYNGNLSPVKVDLPEGKWQTFISSNRVSQSPKSITTMAELKQSSCTVLFQR